MNYHHFSNNRMILHVFRRYSAFEAFFRRLRRPNADVGFVLKRSFWELRSPTNQYVCFTESRSKLTPPLAFGIDPKKVPNLFRDRGTDRSVPRTPFSAPHLVARISANRQVFNPWLSTNEGTPGRFQQISETFQWFIDKVLQYFE